MRHPCAAVMDPQAQAVNLANATVFCPAAAQHASLDAVLRLIGHNLASAGVVAHPVLAPVDNARREDLIDQLDRNGQERTVNIDF